MGLFFIPFLTQTETLVRCHECNSEFISELPVYALQDYSAVDGWNVS